MPRSASAMMAVSTYSKRTHKVIAEEGAKLMGDRSGIGMMSQKLITSIITANK